MCTIVKMNIWEKKLSNVWDDVSSPYDVSALLNISDEVYKSNLANFEGARIVVPSPINLDYLSTALQDYADREIVKFLTYGWPISYTASKFSKVQIC